MKTTCKQQIKALQTAMKSREVELRPRVSASFSEDYEARHQVRLMKDVHYNALNNAANTIAALEMMKPAFEEVLKALVNSSPDDGYETADWYRMQELHNRARHSMERFIQSLTK